MTVIAVPADPPRDGLVLQELVETSPLTAEEAADLYAAMLMDVFTAVNASGGDLLVNYRAAEDLPSAYRGGESPEAELRSLAAAALDDPDAARFEVQVGSGFDARVGNTVTHLLREEAVQSAAVLKPTAPFLFRTTIDSAAMKLRSSEVVLAPAAGGRTAFAGFRSPIDFEDAFDPPELTTLTSRATAEDFGVDFIPMQPVIETGDDLATALSILDARIEAQRIVPGHTAGVLSGLDLEVEAVDGRPRVVRTDNS